MIDVADKLFARVVFPIQFKNTSVFGREQIAYVSSVIVRLLANQIGKRILVS